MTDLEFYLHREAERLGSDRDLRRSAARGETTRIGRGMYVPSALWESLDDDHRSRLRSHVAVARHPGHQLSHDSAAALWRLPSLGPWPTRTHVTVTENLARRPTTNLIRHEWGLDANGTYIDGLLVTSLARTVVDMARTAPFIRAVGMADAALHGIDHGGFPRAPIMRAALVDVLATVAGRPGSSRAARAIGFADERADRLGESVARVQFHALGMPAPELQRAFADRRGRIIPDFYFEEWNVAVEFDGVRKYLRGRDYRPDLSEAEIVILEKRRENRLRRLVRDVIRLEWADVVDRRRLAAILREHGLPV